MLYSIKTYFPLIFQTFCGVVPGAKIAPSEPQLLVSPLLCSVLFPWSWIWLLWLKKWQKWQRRTDEDRVLLCCSLESLSLGTAATTSWGHIMSRLHSKWWKQKEEDEGGACFTFKDACLGVMPSVRVPLVYIWSYLTGREAGEAMFLADGHICSWTLVSVGREERKDGHGEQWMVSAWGGVRHLCVTWLSLQIWEPHCLG